MKLLIASDRVLTLYDVIPANQCHRQLLQDFKTGHCSLVNTGTRSCIETHRNTPTLIVCHDCRHLTAVRVSSDKTQQNCFTSTKSTRCQSTELFHINQVNTMPVDRTVSHQPSQHDARRQRQADEGNEQKPRSFSSR